MEAMNGEILTVESFPQYSDEDMRMMDDGRQLFEKIEHGMGPRMAGLILADGVSTFMRRIDAIYRLISSPESGLAHRIERIIHEADPDAAIRFQTFDQWASQHSNDPDNLVCPIAIFYRGNLPSDIEDQIRTEIVRALDSVMPGLSQQFPNFTLHLVKLPAEGPEAPAEQTAKVNG
jgi:hypothetical protein